MSGISINPGSNTVNTNSTPVMQDWSFDPLSPHEVTYYQGGAVPAAITVATQWKDMIGLSGTQGMTDFQYRMYVGVIGSAPFTVIQLTGDFISGTAWNNGYVNGMAGDVVYSFINLSMLAPGLYNFNIYHQVRATSNGLVQTIAEKVVSVKLTVYSATAPEITGSFNFKRTIGNPGTVFKNITVTAAVWKLKVPAGFSFTVAEGVTIEQTADGGYTASGSGTKSFQVGCTAAVEPDEITQNPLPFAIDVNDGQMEVPMSVTFFNESGLYISNHALVFTAYKGIQDAASQLVGIEHQLHEFFLELPAFLSAAAVPGGYWFTPLSANNMEAGQYTGEIRVKQNGLGNPVLGVITVVYNVVDAIDSPYPYEYGFTLDNNYITLLSQQDNTYYDITVNARIYNYYSNVFTDRQFMLKARLFQKRQQFNLGKAIDKMMSKLPHFEGWGANNPYLPAEVALQLTERSDTDANYIQEYSLPTIKFYAGLTPPGFTGTGILDMNAGAARITPAGYAYLNFLVRPAPGYPYLNVYRHRGGEAVLIQSSGFQMGLQTLKVMPSGARAGDMYEYRMMRPGGTAIGSKFFKVFPEGRESNHIVWENEYKLKSALEFTGDYSIKSDFENRSQSLVRNLVDVLEKIESNKVTKFTINTGWILKSDMPLVENLCRAKRAALVNGDEIIHLVPTQKTLANTDNRRELYDYEIEFEINRDFNEKVYSL